MTNSPLNTLATYLIGEFENQAQAAESPAWFVHLKLWQQRVPSLSSASVHTLFLEQASVVGTKPPYRQRILQLSQKADQKADQRADQKADQKADRKGGQLRGEYFALAQPSKFIGAATDDTLLSQLSTDDLISLPNSEAHIQYQPVANGYQFQSALPEGKLCSFEYGGQRRYVYLGFDIGPKPDGGIELLTYDKGIAPDTGRGLWGALMGPFRMVKKIENQAAIAP